MANLSLVKLNMPIKKTKQKKLKVSLYSKTLIIKWKSIIVYLHKQTFVNICERLLHI